MKLYEVADSKISSKQFKVEINKNCSKFLSTVKTKYYRGINTREKFLKLPVRTDRQPLNTPLSLHVLLNCIIESQTKVPNIRNKSLFITPDPDQADYYGEIYRVILPNGGKFVYNPDVYDIYDDVINNKHFPLTIAEWCIDNGIMLYDNANDVIYNSLKSYINKIDGLKPITLEYDDTVASLSKEIGKYKLQNLFKTLTTKYPALDGYTVSNYANIEDAEVMVYGIKYYYAMYVGESVL